MEIVRLFYSFVKAFLVKLAEILGKDRYLKGVKIECLMVKMVSVLKFPRLNEFLTDQSICGKTAGKKTKISRKTLLKPKSI